MEGKRNIFVMRRALTRKQFQPEKLNGVPQPEAPGVRSSNVDGTLEPTAADALVSSTEFLQELHVGAGSES